MFEKFVVLLTDWNKKVNLVSRRDADNIWANHILHSISPLFKIILREDAVILDLGTGGGLPGIPLRIMMPLAEMTMLDSTQKKITAVKDMIQRMDLIRTQALWGRAEDVGLKKGYIHSFHYVVARAVGPLADLVRLSKPFLFRSHTAPDEANVDFQPATVFPPALIVFKGGDLEKEISQIRSLKFVKAVDVIQLAFEGSEEVSLTDKKLVLVRF